MGTFEITPSNEISTREWFAYHLRELPYTIISSGAAFPDYLLQDNHGDMLRTEIEFDSYNFIQHGHKSADCDLVMCWVHTFALPLPVYELQSRKLYAAGQCDVVRKERPPEYIEKARKHAKKDRAKKRAAIELVRTEYLAFFELLNKDMNEWTALTKTLQPTRLALLEAGEILTSALRANGYAVETLHPYDLANELVRLVEP